MTTFSFSLNHSPFSIVARDERTLEAVSSRAWLGARARAHQGLKACLNKMLVEGQGLVYPGFAHDTE